MAFKIYTKTGDKGKTSLIGGAKVSKSHIRIDAYGTVDELNAYLGLVIDYQTHTGTRALLQTIQDRLFVVGASLASDPEKEQKMSIPDLLPEDIQQLEQAIDNMEASLEPLKYFLLPGGHVAVSTCHIARTVCRRAERLCVAMQEAGQLVVPEVLQYLNRLSDYLFVLARFTSFQLGVAEIPWRPRKRED
ncbi:cob(I)alamin adenosyltransferase [Chitinophaga costaii]|uniref:Corrinoid adenosyltransferase n=1 Tax=Chitinophaga costaii TaxID=1335309 RepID=A0A1C4C0G8_9BACT|nr:cob(I)yrinic acid a,c-diamide adenosyltransferase [Chitinophaga costaii]PUZ27390.1 cob(I)yrinic acid a,c-diamide adenosyltransferase [Chitinophaga costaii]SCC12619.1 cob(I)alamin adenosyltransferase [Chitinophaga costaii]